MQSRLPIVVVGLATHHYVNTVQHVQCRHQPMQPMPCKSILFNKKVLNLSQMIINSLQYCLFSAIGKPRNAINARLEMFISIIKLNVLSACLVILVFSYSVLSLTPNISPFSLISLTRIPLACVSLYTLANSCL